MSKTILAAAASLAALTAAACAQDAPRSVYLDLGLGVAVPTEDGLEQSGDFVDFDDARVPFEDEFAFDQDVGAVFRVLLGYEVTPEVAFEVEAKGLGHNVEQQDGGIGVGAFMANAVYRQDGPGRVTPYVGAGVGYASLDFFDADGDRFSDDFGGAFAWQVKGGALYELGLRHGVALEGAYLSTSGFEETVEDEFGRTVSEVDYAAFTATVSYQYRFTGRR